MAFPYLFNKEVSVQLIQRLETVKKEQQPQWGKMNAAQMFAHLNVMFELALESKHPVPNRFIRCLLKTMLKSKLTNEVCYKKNSRTAPEMIIKHSPNFEEEKKRTIHYLSVLSEKGDNYFENKEHPSFGVLTTKEWNSLFYKHIDHHLKQFNS